MWESRQLLDEMMIQTGAEKLTISQALVDVKILVPPCAT